MPRMLLIRVVLFLVGLVALAMIPSLVMAVVDGDGQVARAFGLPMAIAAVVVAPAVVLGRRSRGTIRSRDGFLVVSAAWLLTGIFGAMPFMLSQTIPSVADAVFESVSGFSTTGASILSDIESLPRSLLFWRSMTHWLGGMGIVVLTVALLPLYGVGGFQLLKAEAPGPEKDKVVPKITEGAKILWLIYVALTAAQVVLLMIGGMDWFDATTHAFGTMATGGFSPKNRSVGHYNSAWIDGVVTLFMVLAGVNFSLYYRVTQGKFADLWRNSELRAYLGIFVVVTAALTVTISPLYNGIGTAVRYAGFQAASVLTTTGYATTDFDLWPSAAKALLFVLMFIGGSSGSTGGGIKVVRILVLAKQAGNEIRRLLYPTGVFSVRLNGRVGRKDVVYGVAGFLFLYLSLVLATTVVVAGSGADITTALSAALATVGNIGPGFAAVGPTMNYAAFPSYVKWFLSFAMIAGRLELWTVFVLLSPRFWRD